MNNRLKILCLILLISISAGKLHAQETMFKDLSYTFLEKLIATAKQNYPQVKALHEQVNIARSTYHQSNFTWLDAFNASYIYSPQSSINLTQPTIFKGYQLVATVNLGALFEKPYGIHNAKLAVTVAEDNEAQYMLTLEAQVKRFYFAYIEAQADLRSRVNAVLDATTAVNQLKHNYEKGEAAYDIYNQALTNLYNQNSFRLQSELNLFTAKTNLEELLGTKLESIK